MRYFNYSIHFYNFLHFLMTVGLAKLLTHLDLHAASRAQTAPRQAAAPARLLDAENARA